MSFLLSLLDFLPEFFNPFKPFIAFILFIVAGVIVFAAFMKSGGFIINSIKDFIRSKENKRLAYTDPLNVLTLSDDEFKYLDYIRERFGFKRPHIASSVDGIAACNNLTNRGVFVRNKDGSYTITTAGINMIYLPQTSNKSLIIRIINKILPKKSKNP